MYRTCNLCWCRASPSKDIFPSVCPTVCHALVIVETAKYRFKLFQYRAGTPFYFYHMMLCINAAYAVVWCLSGWLSVTFKITDRRRIKMVFWLSSWLSDFCQINIKCSRFLLLNQGIFITQPRQSHATIAVLSVCLCLSVCLFVRLSVCLCLSVCLSVCLWAG